VFVSPGISVHEDARRDTGTGPRPTEAWRSAVRRRGNVRVALIFWLVNGLLVMADAAEQAWIALRHL
jgi:hypothetical protein